MLGFLLVGGCASVGAQGVPRTAPERDAGQASPPEKRPTIQVTGSASVTVPADRARVTFAVESREQSAQGTSQANAAAMTAVLSALHGAGFQGLHIDTYGYSLSPVYTSVANQDGSRVQRIDGYRALNNVRATLTDLSAVGKLIDTATAAGANRVSGISFEASDPEQAQQKALAEAVRRAREQARTIAAALDRELGPPIEVSGGAQTPTPPRPMMFAAAARMEAETPIEAADQTVSASVTITFALGPERTSR
jgi:hypothetical protein